MKLKLEELSILFHFAMNNPKRKRSDTRFKPPSMDNNAYQEICSSLIQKGLINKNWQITHLGAEIAESKTKGINFKNKAKERGIKYSISMIIGGFCGLVYHTPKATEYELNLIKKLFTTVDEFMDKVGSKIKEYAH